jgi:hypothetical protein
VHAPKVNDGQGGRIRPPAQHRRAPYDAARRALSAAVAIDEVKDILDKSIAMEVCAYQSGDRELMAWSAEMKRRSGRRLGPVMEEQRAAGKLAKPVPGSGRGKVGSAADPTFKNAPTLAEQGIDEHLADRARKASLGAMFLAGR